MPHSPFLFSLVCWTGSFLAALRWGYLPKSVPDPCDGTTQEGNQHLSHNCRRVWMDVHFHIITHICTLKLTHTLIIHLCRHSCFLPDRVSLLRNFWDWCVFAPVRLNICVWVCRRVTLHLIFCPVSYGTKLNIWMHWLWNCGTVTVLANCRFMCILPFILPFVWVKQKY